jgi:hypothetical protein
MSRVTDEDVTGDSGIITTDANPAPFIRMATAFVDQHLTGKGLSDEMLYSLELLLAAHYLCLIDPRESEIELGTQEARVKFEGKYGTGLKFTRYGQQAEALDPTGILAESSKPAASLLVMGEGDITT